MPKRDFVLSTYAYSIHGIGFRLDEARTLYLAIIHKGIVQINNGVGGRETAGAVSRRARAEHSTLRLSTMATTEEADQMVNQPEGTATDMEKKDEYILYEGAVSCCLACGDFCERRRASIVCVLFVRTNSTGRVTCSRSSRTRSRRPPSGTRTHYKITNKSIEITTGVCCKSIENVDVRRPTTPALRELGLLTPRVHPVSCYRCGEAP